MNVFEDLIVELKEENLLEKTVMDPDAPESVSPAEAPGDGLDSPVSAGGIDDDAVGESEPATRSETESSGDAASAGDAVLVQPDQPKALRKPRNGNEFYKQRAVGELSNLQMVEHVLTGVEREYMKIVPNAYDDFAAKKALHAFLRVAENENSQQHAEAEFALMTETESWCSALGERDRNVSVSSVRLYCENSRPPLSSQALVALARFYRNLPYTEAVRAKFDFVMTRLFSRPADNSKRDSLFTRDETLSHINTLYREWSSIALYSAGQDESKLLLTALSFEDLAIEAENTPNFDALVKSDFFSRLRLFKESVSELFYAPQIAAAAIECNIRVGNAYVNLLARERLSVNAGIIQEKYADTNNQAVSDAAGRTLDLVDILRESTGLIEPEEPEERDPEQERLDAQVLTSSPNAALVPIPTTEADTRPGSRFFGHLIENALSINKWLLAVSIALISISVGIYIWANFVVEEDRVTAGVQTLELEGSPAREHVKSARVSGTTLYALMQPSWDLLPKEKRREILQHLYQAAVEKGCKQVRLTTGQGKAAGYATATRVEVVMP